MRDTVTSRLEWPDGERVGRTRQGALRGAPRRLLVRLALAASLLGVLLLAWVGVVWVWQDPFTALYTLYQQHELSLGYKQRGNAFPFLRVPGADPRAELQAIAREAARYRLELRPGEAAGTITVPRLGLDSMMLVDGTSDAALERGPGIYRGDYLPGEHQLVYVAGHRTTFLAPFADINDLRPGDAVTIGMPYGRFLYRITGSRIVPANDVRALRTHHREQLVLQACQPRFFATHRYLAYAHLVEVVPTGRAPISGPLLRQA